jgi:hypothetical protein
MFNIGGRFKVGGVTIGANIPIGSSRYKKNPKDIERKFEETKTPKNSLTRMMAQVTSGNMFSRPYLYRVIMPLPPILLPIYSSSQVQNVMLNCETLAIPGYTIATKEIRTYGERREYAYAKMFDTMTMGFYMSDQLSEFKYFNSWMDHIYDRGRVRYYNEYTSNMKIYQLSGYENGVDEEDLRVVMEVELLDAYPKSISPLQLGHGLQGQIQKMTTDVMYRKATYKDYTRSDNGDGVQNLGQRIKEAGITLQSPFEQFKLPKWTQVWKKQLNTLPAKSLEQNSEHYEVGARQGFAPQ